VEQAFQQAPPPPQYAAAPAPPPPQQSYVIGAPPPRRAGAPAWLGVVVTLLVLGGGLFGLYKFIDGRNAIEKPLGAAAAPAEKTASGTHPFAKHIEVVGIRLLETADKKPLVRFVVINHSPAKFTGLALRVSFVATNGNGDAFATVAAPVGDIPAYGTKDMEAPLQTQMRIYELPDWQFVRPQVEVTAPR
jgi:hypothetical protein